MVRISTFSGEYDFLSNFVFCDMIFETKKWKTAEHAFQAMKTTEDHERVFIQELETPGRAKRAGRKVTLRADWEDVKNQIMLEITRAKFNQNTTLARKLIETGSREIIEGNNWHDNYWGNCSCHNCKHIPGKNVLGKILMKVREELKEA